ncbi:hypothetical protein, partial [Streptomyces sp. P17]|uniref:hypothetical protein n=1 Tax=Streptomyces sp. P17 TaxID=3074716 RepID=UPI0028F42FCF
MTNIRSDTSEQATEKAPDRSGAFSFQPSAGSTIRAVGTFGVALAFHELLGGFIQLVAQHAPH